jgi:opacity protein-like surface antigen
MRTPTPARLILVLATLLPLGTQAQAPAYGAPSYGQAFTPGFELAGMAGYHVSSDLSLASGSVGIDGSPSYGAALRARIRPGQTAELLWVIVPTNAHVRSTLGVGDASLTINYFQLGGSTGFRRDRLEPYLAGSLGAAVYSPGTLVVSGGTRFEGSDIWRFAFTLGGGLKIWLADVLALQLEARMMAPVWFSSAAFYAGGGGAAFGVSGGIPVVEGNFTGGLVLAPR